jgi:small subunit ribosomal protein S21
MILRQKRSILPLTTLDQLPILPLHRDKTTVAKPFSQVFFRNPKENIMPEVVVRKGEPIDRALKRLKNKLDAEGVMEEVRRLRAFETPTQKTKRKARANAKRAKLKFRFSS